MSLKLDTEVLTARGRYDFDIKLGADTIFICELKSERLAKREGESRGAAVERLKAAGIKKAKDQIESRGYAVKARSEFKTVKRVAVAIVDRTEVAVEIY
jgi:hypothetical protein